MNKFSFISKLLKSGSKGIIFLVGMVFGVIITVTGCDCDFEKLLNSNFEVENVLDESFKINNKNSSNGESHSDKIESDLFAVERVIDGDTLVIEGGEKIRFIGIDTPERGKFYYKEATNYLKELVGDKKIRLEKDISERDRWGRLLRHVYVDNVWINAKMIEDGYARFVTFPPDISHVDKFKELEKLAKKNKRGLWSGNVE